MPEGSLQGYVKASKRLVEQVGHGKSSATGSIIAYSQYICAS